MRKRGFVIIEAVFVLAVFLINFCAAAENESDAIRIDNAYKCLNDKIANAASIGLQDAIFDMLALGAKKQLDDKIRSEKSSTENCWPKDGCKIKETAQVLLAYDRAGKDTEGIENWLLSKNASATELVWYLEIDIQNKEVSTCTIKYDGKSYNIKISDEQKISGNTGNCFSNAKEGYMLKVSNNCFGKEFEISCDKNFVTSMIYEKSSGGTIFVPGKAESAASGGTTKAKVVSQCFKTTGAGCDYEGSLWAVMALQKKGLNIEAFMPYLYAFADANKRFFPSAFLYILTGGDDQYNQIISLQKQGQFWDIIASPYGKWYDSALALMALSKGNSQEAENAKTYLLSVQTPDGCWNNNNIRDTGFILYSAFTRGVTRESGSGEVPKCESPFICTGLFECTNAGGKQEYNYDCSSEGAAKICCSINVAMKTCSEKGGILCGSGEQCSGRVEAASDGSCCFGVCETIPVQEETCSAAGGTCKSMCEENEEEIEETCSSMSEVCCKSKGSSLWIWIIILIVLIALTIVGIVYRAQLRLFWMKNWPKIKEKFTKKSAPSIPTQQPQARAPMQAPQMQRAIPRPAYPVRLGQPATRASRDKEIEETLKKLKEMGR